VRALTYQGPDKVAVVEVADPVLTDEYSAVVRVTTAGICGSDLHIYHGHGFSPDIGYCLGHEAVGTVEAVGSRVEQFAVGDRVLVPASVGCSTCRQCRIGLIARCENAVRGDTVPCYGLSHALPGSQAEAVAVPHAATNLVAISPELSDADAVVLTDNAPTGWYGARRGRITPGDTVAVIGLGPVGLMAVQSAFVLGAAAVYGVDPVASRLARAAELGAVPIESADAKRAIRAATGGGVDVAVEAVGADASIGLAISAVRSGGRVSVIGVSQNKAYPMHLMAAQVRELEFAIGLCSVQYELPTLLSLTVGGRLRPAAVVSHRVPLSDAADAYRQVADRDDGVSKILLDPAS
jgi:threonine dehydrogenase-like Zn-dependent dehydrogenase